MPGRRQHPWTSWETQFLREHYPFVSAQLIARILHRQHDSVRHRVTRLGLRKLPRKYFAADTLEHIVRAWHARGFSDAEIARLACCYRKRISRVRRCLGLPSNRQHPRQRNRVRQKTAVQLDRENVDSLAGLRSKVFRERARAAGWPPTLRLRQIDILNVLWSHGPRTRRQLADDIGLRWLGSRKTFKCKCPGGSYLAGLVRQGLVVRMPRAYPVRGEGRGKTQDLYSLPLCIQRGPVTSPEKHHAEKIR